MTRQVVLLCGPPGAGKTTWAHESGLDVYDIDEPIWRNSEKLFTAAIAKLAHDPDAQAVVIRSGATKRARHRHAARIRATETIILDVDPETCIQRIRQRKRPRPPLSQQVAAVGKWWQTYQREVANPKDKSVYGPAHRRARDGMRIIVNAGRATCCLCGEPIAPGTPWDLDHEPGTDRYRGAAHASCNRSEGAVRGNQLRLQSAPRWNL